MASKKDMRRGDLVVPFSPPDKKDTQDVQSTISSTLPMIAMFTRNKLMGWASVILALQHWLAETPAQKAAASSPAYLSIGMAVMALLVGYLPIFLPPPAPRTPDASGPAAPSAAAITATNT